MNATVIDRVWAVMAVTLTGLVLFGATGCGSSTDPQSGEPRVDVFPAPIQILVNNKPESNLRVFVRAIDRQTGPSTDVMSFTNDSGTAQFDTYGVGDGLPAGKYAVFVTKPLGITDDPASERDEFSGRYNNPKKPMFTVEVTTDNRPIPPINLK